MSETWQEKPDAGRAAWPFICCSRQGGLLVAALLGLIGAGFTALSLNLTFGDLALPGPGFFPFALGLLLIALSVAVFVMALQEPRNVLHVEVGHMPVLIAFAAMCVSAALFETAGAFLSLTGFSFVMLVLVGRVHVVTALLSSVVGMLICWYIFKVLLGVQLPAGPFEGIL